MQIVVVSSWHASVWVLFSTDTPPKMPFTMESIAEAVESFLQSRPEAKSLKSLQVYSPDGDHLALKYRPMDCVDCSETEQFSAAWCPQHTWWGADGSDTDADTPEQQAIAHGVPQWIVDALSELNTGYIRL